MARRRMFSLDVVDTDSFLDLPSSSQALYFHLGMRADDDGFVRSPRRITSMAGCSPDDLKLLAVKGFVILFESGICVIRDWKKNNYIQSDRRTDTAFVQERAMLEVSEDRSYRLMESTCIQSVSILDTQDRRDKRSIEQGRIEEIRPDESNLAEKRLGGVGDGAYKPLSETDFEIRRQMGLKKLGL